MKASLMTADDEMFMKWLLIGRQSLSSVSASPDRHVQPRLLHV